MKTETKVTLAGTIFVIFVLVVLGMMIYFYNEREEEKLDCLEPYALKICQERNLHYYSHTPSVTFCKEDIRNVGILRFTFNRTEKSDCGIGGF